jgi:hypothetical protein
MAGVPAAEAAIPARPGLAGNWGGVRHPGAAAPVPAVWGAVGGPAGKA